MQITFVNMDRYENLYPMHLMTRLPGQYQLIIFDYNVQKISYTTTRDINMSDPHGNFIRLPL